jgi:hypothetical protein
MTGDGSGSPVIPTGEACCTPRMARAPHPQLATRRIGVDRVGSGGVPGVGAGAVDEYLALQGAAVHRLVGCGVEASAAALHLRASRACGCRGCGSRGPPRTWRSPVPRR